MKATNESETGKNSNNRQSTEARKLQNLNVNQQSCGQKEDTHREEWTHRFHPGTVAVILQFVVPLVKIYATSRAMIG